MPLHLCVHGLWDLHLHQPCSRRPWTQLGAVGFTHRSFWLLTLRANQKVLDSSGKMPWKSCIVWDLMIRGDPLASVGECAGRSVPARKGAKSSHDGWHPPVFSTIGARAELAGAPDRIVRCSAAEVRSVSPSLIFSFKHKSSHHLQFISIFVCSRLSELAIDWFWDAVEL